jgi:hypothetical protein
MKKKKMAKETATAEKWTPRPTAAAAAAAVEKSKTGGVVATISITATFFDIVTIPLIAIVFFDATRMIAGIS